MQKSIEKRFLEASEEWLCAGYSVDIRYLILPGESGLEIFHATISLGPLATMADGGFHVADRDFEIGRIQMFDLSLRELSNLLSEVVSKGALEIERRTFKLPSTDSLTYYSEMTNTQRWYRDLHLTVNGDARGAVYHPDLEPLDEKLRRFEKPFDGLADAVSWLGLIMPGGGHCPSIEIRILPPVDLDFERSRLSNGEFNLSVVAQTNFSHKDIKLALNVVPREALEGRLQVTERLNWLPPNDEIQRGSLTIQVDDALQVLVMLMAGSVTVRRHWFIDPLRARSSRAVSVQHFDRELRMVNRALFDLEDSAKFEAGVASLMFLLGFDPAQLIETDAPDLVVISPLGKIIIVECTTRTSDIESKIGKLVDRRGSLGRALSAAQLSTDVVAMLVCRSPRDQIAAHTKVLESHQVILWSKENLEDLITRVPFANNPDEMIESAIGNPSSSLGHLFAETDVNPM